MQWAALLSSWEITCLPGIQARPSWWNLFWEQHLLLGVKLRVTGACGLPPHLSLSLGWPFADPSPLGQNPGEAAAGSFSVVIGALLNAYQHARRWMWALEITFAERSLVPAPAFGFQKLWHQWVLYWAFFLWSACKTWMTLVPGLSEDLYDACLWAKLESSAFPGEDSHPAIRGWV